MRLRNRPDRRDAVPLARFARSGDLTVIQDIRWKAPGRLWKRSRQLSAQGNHAHVVTVAIARALAGCLWAMAMPVPVPPKPKTAYDATTHAEGWPTCIGRDAAPVWWNPRQRDEARRGHSSRERGRPPTEARKVGA